jgi:hypothetical protein
VVGGGIGVGLLVILGLWLGISWDRSNGNSDVVNPAIVSSVGQTTETAINTPTATPTRPIATPSATATQTALPPATQTAKATVTSTATASHTPSPTASPLPAFSVPVAVISADVVAILVDVPVVVDGVLDEWAEVPAFSSAHRVYQHPNWDNSQDISAQWQLQWDTTFLYVAVTVADDRHVQTQSGNQIFRGDSVEMQIDTNRQEDWGTGFSSDDIQIALSPGDFATLPPSAFRFQGSDGGQVRDAPGHEIVVVAQPTTSGYLLESAIPWRALALTPRMGLTIGLALNVTDNDSPNTAIQEVMMSNAPDRILLDPTSWGTLTLKGETE